MEAETFRDFLNLDMTTTKVLQKSKNGLSKDLRELSIKDTEHPLHFTT